MQVGVRVEEEELSTGARHHCCSAYLTFVSVAARSGVKLPQLVPGNSAYYKEHHEAAQA